MDRKFCGSLDWIGSASYVISEYPSSSRFSTWNLTHVLGLNASTFFGRDYFNFRCPNFMSTDTRFPMLYVFCCPPFLYLRQVYRQSSFAYYLLLHSWIRELHLSHLEFFIKIYPERPLLTKSNRTRRNVIL